MVDPTIRERLRELAEAAETLRYGRDMVTWIRTTNVPELFVMEATPTAILVLLDELDTLERRAIAATELETAARNVVGAVAAWHLPTTVGGPKLSTALVDLRDAVAALEASRGSD